MNKIQNKRCVCVDPWAKPNWKAPIARSMRSTFNGEKLMATSYVTHKSVKRNGNEVEYRGIRSYAVCRVLESPVRFPKYLIPFCERNGWRLPKNRVEV